MHFTSYIFAVMLRCLSYLQRVLYYLDEALRLERGSADKHTVDVRLEDDALCILGLYAAAVQYDELIGRLCAIAFRREAAYELADLFRVGVAGRLAGTDGPDGFVGDDHLFRDDLSLHTLKPLDKLSLDDLEGLSRFAFLKRLTDAKNRGQAALYGCVYLFVELFVYLAEDVTSLAVADQDMRRADLRDHRHRYFARKGAAFFPMCILRADYHRHLFSAAGSGEQ